MLSYWESKACHVLDSFLFGIQIRTPVCNGTLPRRASESTGGPDVIVASWAKGPGQQPGGFQSDHDILGKSPGYATITDSGYLSERHCIWRWRHVVTWTGPSNHRSLSLVTRQIPQWIWVKPTIYHRLWNSFWILALSLSYWTVQGSIHDFPSYWEANGVGNRFFVVQIHAWRRLNNLSKDWEKARDLCSIKQGTNSICDYAICFCTLATDSGWNGTALYDVFLNGLSV